MAVESIESRLGINAVHKDKNHPFPLDASQKACSLVQSGDRVILRFQTLVAIFQSQKEENQEEAGNPQIRDFPASSAFRA